MVRSTRMLVILMVAVTFILSACDVLFGTEEEKPSHLVVSSLSVSKAPLAATVSWIDPADTNISRIKITIDPPITGVAQPLFVDKGIQHIDVSWPEWTGLTYTFTFTAVDSSGTEYSSITLPVTPGGPEWATCPAHLQGLAAYPVKGGTGVTWGSGYDSIRGEPLEGCALITEDAQLVMDTMNAQVLDTSIALVESTTALNSFIQEKTGVGVEVSGSYGPFSASASVDVSNSRSLDTELKTSNTNLIIYQRCRGPVYTLGGDLDFKESALTATPATFFDLYGDRYAHSVLCGYDVYILLEIETSSTEEKEALAESIGVSASAGAYGVSASVSVNTDKMQSLSTAIGTTKKTLTAKTFGWTGAAFTGLDVNTLLAQLEAYYNAYLAAKTSESSANVLWDGGTVEVHYRSYFPLLDNFVPNYPYIEGGTATQQYRQLNFDILGARYLSERFYEHYGLPNTWSTTYDATSVSYLEDREAIIEAEVNRLVASRNQIQQYTTAAQFAAWSAAIPSFIYTAFEFGSVAMKPGGTPPAGYTIWQPTWEKITTTGTLLSEYDPDLFLAKLYTVKIAKGAYKASLPKLYSYYIAWEELLTSGIAVDSSLYIDGVKRTSSSGSTSFSLDAQSLPSLVQLQIDGSGRVSCKFYIYRKALGTGGTIITPIIPIIPVIPGLP